MKNYLYENALKLNIELDDLKLQQFIDYYNLLIEWNSFMNLTGITESKDVIIKHFIDSLCLVKFSQEDNYFINNSLSIIDVGTGAGFPGIPLKIAFPNLEITLLDSLNKRIHFLQEVISILGLKSISAIHGRAEDYAKNKNYREKFDFVVSRAVANLSTLSEYCLPYVKCGGYFISYKSEKALQEIDSANTAIDILGGNIVNKIDYDLNDNLRSLIIIKKNKITPDKYPRKSGLPSKRPL